MSRWHTGLEMYGERAEVMGDEGRTGRERWEKEMNGKRGKDDSGCDVRGEQKQGGRGKHEDGMKTAR